MSVYSHWWFPGTSEERWWESSDDYETIDLGFQVMVDYDPLRTVQRMDQGYGYGVPFVQGGGERVRISYKMGELERLADKHMALLSVLREGGAVSFSNLVATAWAVALPESLDRGDTVFAYETSPFTEYTAFSPVIGAECIVQSSSPELRRELVTVSDVGGGDVTLTGLGSHTGLVQSYLTFQDQEWRPILKPRYFFPFLRMVPGQDYPVRQINGTSWAFDAEFTIDVRMEHRYIGFVEA